MKKSIYHLKEQGIIIFVFTIINLPSMFESGSALYNSS